MIVTAKNLELRGIANRTTKSGNLYYLVNVEEPDGTPLQFYCKDSSAFADGLKKGVSVDIDFEYKKYQNEESLVVKCVRPCEV